MDSMANNAVAENGPAASELRCRCASLHHGLGLWPAAYKDVARTSTRELPSTSSSQPHQVCPSCSEPVKDKPLRVALTRPSFDCSCARRPLVPCGSGRGVISSSGEGDRAAESLEVKGAVGWETGQIRTGRRATWQAVANGRTVEASKLFHPLETDCGNIGSAEPLILW